MRIEWGFCIIMKRVVSSLVVWVVIDSFKNVSKGFIIARVFKHVFQVNFAISETSSILPPTPFKTITMYFAFGLGHRQTPQTCKTYSLFLLDSTLKF